MPMVFRCSSVSRRQPVICSANATITLSARAETIKRYSYLLLQQALRAQSLLPHRLSPCVVWYTIVSYAVQCLKCLKSKGFKNKLSIIPVSTPLDYRSSRRLRRVTKMHTTETIRLLRSAYDYLFSLLKVICLIRVSPVPTTGLSNLIVSRGRIIFQTVSGGRMS